MARYPELTRRYMSSLIDSLLVLTGAIAIAGVLQDERVTLVRVPLILLVVLSYEPVLTSKRCTAGQYAMGIRVRRHENPTEKIDLASAYLRYVVKLVLGFYSFFAMGFNPQKRAAHDLAAGSVVVNASSA